MNKSHATIIWLFVLNRVMV